ncbi:MAG: ABC transporter substrate-binding protein [Treponemataceae bacterium]
MIKIKGKSKFTLLLMLLILALGITACGLEKEERVESSDNDEIIFVEREIMANHDPNFYPGSIHYVKTKVGELLFKIQNDGSIEPELAKSLEQVNETEWIVELRPEAKFWSGTPVTSEKVIGSLERSRETNTKVVSSLEGLKFEIIDDYSFKVKTERPNMAVPEKLSYFELCIINPDMAHDSVETMDMTGMYKIVSFEPKKKLIAEINEDYYGKKPKIKRIIQEQISDNETRSLSVLSGRADIVSHISNESIPQLEASDEVVVYSLPAANTETIYLNTKKEPLNDQNVRQALSYALDREELVLLGSEGKSKVTTNWISSNPKYEDISKEIYGKANSDKASKLLESSGYAKNDSGLWEKDGKPLSIKLMTWGQDKALGEAIQAQWMNFGINAEVQYGDYSLIETARESGDWDASIEAWQTYGDEYGLMSSQFSPNGSGNFSHYESPSLTEKLNALENATTPKEKEKAAKELSLKVAEEAIAIYIYPRVETTAVSSKLKGFEGHFRQIENIITADLTFEE